LEKSEDDIREAIASSKSEMRKDLVEKNQLKREEKKTYFDEIREDKMFQFDVKRKVAKIFGIVLKINYFNNL
jgi:hypothetical protein